MEKLNQGTKNKFAVEIISFFFP